MRKMTAIIFGGICLCGGFFQNTVLSSPVNTELLASGTMQEIEDNRAFPPEINLIKKGRDFFLTEKMEDALHSFEEAIKCNPANVDPYLHMGVIFLELKKWDKAIDIMEKAIAACPLEDEPFFLLGKALREKSGDPHGMWKSHKSFESAVEFQTSGKGYILDPVFAYKTASELQPKREIYFRFRQEARGPNLPENFLEEMENSFCFREKLWPEKLLENKEGIFYKTILPRLKQEIPKSFEYYLRAREFQVLEEIFSALTAKKDRDADGFREIFKLRGLAFSLKNYYPKEYENYQSLLKDWLGEFPASPFAHACTGLFFLQKAWNSTYHRGMERHGWGSTSTNDREWCMYRENLLLAREYLEKAVEQGLNDPVVFADLMTVATNLGLSRQDLDHYFENALKSDPSDFLPYAKKLEYLKPKWHGSISEMLTFARSCASIPNSLAPLVIPMAHLETSICTGNQEYFRNPAVWSEVKSVLQDILKTFPQSLKVHNWYAKLACLAGETETAKKEFEIIRSDWSEECWGNFKKFNMARKALFGEIPDSLTTPIQSRFSRSAGGVITDVQTGLQWLEGPDKPMRWSEAQEWINNLGNGWRTPTLTELKGICIFGSRLGGPFPLNNVGSMPLHLDPAFQLDRSYLVWSVEKDSQSAWSFSFAGGSEMWQFRNAVAGEMAFAVRSNQGKPDAVKEPILKGD
ncbi:MAG: tetratricopeptide repeat protein [Candidatus Ozemobacteraceae bacterium]